MAGTARLATGATLLGIAGLHVSWGRGSTFPFRDREQLDESVVGKPQTPNPAGVASVLATRAALGFAGRTDLVSPGSVSAKFRHVDRKVLAPMCLVLALGAIR